MQFEVKTVVAIGGSAYGVGSTIKEAERNLKREDPKAAVKVYRFYSCERKELTFECGVDLAIFAPESTHIARIAT